MHSLTVLVKATFLLVHGAEAAVAPAQEEPSGDVAWEKDPGAFLRFATDFAPLKPRTDVLVVGHAHAPEGAPVTEVACRIEMGDFVKVIRVAGDLRLGPVAPSQPPRRALVSDEGYTWATAERGEGRGAAPEGFDFTFFQAAPPDQQIPLLRPGATLVLEHLHPTVPRLETRLPAARPQAFRIDPRTGRVSEIALRCDTVTIDADRGRVSLVFRGLTDVPTPAPTAVGTIVVASHPQGLRVRPADIEKVVRQGGSLEDVAGAPEKHPLEMRHDTRRLGQVRSGGTTSAGAAPPTSALPFRPASGSPAPAAPPRPAALPFGSGTLLVGASSSVVRPATPFERAPAPVDLDEDEPEPPTPARVSVPPASSRVLPFQEASPRPPQPEETPRVAPGTGLPFVSAGVAAPAPAPAPASEAPIPFAPMDAVRPALVTAPMLPSPETVEAPESGPPALPEAALRLPLPLERYSSIAAEIAGPTVDVGMTLRRHGLDEEKWASIEAESTAVIAEDAVRGEGRLLEAFDRLYVARMVALGRAVDAQGHARLSVATAHGKLSRCLDTLGLGRADLLPLRRSLARRMTKDPAYAAELRAALEAERVASPPPEVGLLRPPRRERAPRTNGS